jgi:hypothetical protein
MDMVIDEYGVSMATLLEWLRTRREMIRKDVIGAGQYKRAVQEYHDATLAIDAEIESGFRR